MKILVTGGTGFIGSALCAGLLQTGHTVRVFDNDSRGTRRRLAPLENDLEFARGDIRQSETVRAAASGVDCVCHLAAVNGTEFFYSKPQLVLEVAVKGMMNVLDACVTEGVRQLLTASSSEVYQLPPHIPTAEDAPLIVPDPLNPRYSYGGGKIISELLTLNYGLTFLERAIVFRPHNVYGPDMGREHVIPQIALRLLRTQAEARGAREFDFPIQGNGSETRSFLFIDDMVRGILTLLERGEHRSIYHIGNAGETTIRELVEAMARELDLAPRIISGALQPGSVKRRCPDITKIRRLGYEPVVTLREGLKRTLPWYQANP